MRKELIPVFVATEGSFERALVDLVNVYASRGVPLVMIREVLRDYAQGAITSTTITSRNRPLKRIRKRKKKDE